MREFNAIGVGDTLVITDTKYGNVIRAEVLSLNSEFIVVNSLSEIGNWKVGKRQKLLAQEFKKINRDSRFSIKVLDRTLDKTDILQLIDMALDYKDKEWFDELMVKYKNLN